MFGLDKYIINMKNNIYLITFFVSLLSISCGSDEVTPLGSGCDASNSPIFSETNGLLLVEFEQASFGENWKLINDLSNSTGDGYMRWEGEDQFGNPGQGLTTFQLNISTTGTYRFVWRSAVTEGDNPTEANDSWLRFADADNFYGEKNNGSLVYPNGLGKSPTPEGASKDGWFKVYRSGDPLDFKWQSRTSDNDAHNIYITFNSPGTYTMEVSGRSHGHAIDKFVMFQEATYSLNEAIESTIFSDFSCN
jgi:hypothetical protein